MILPDKYYQVIKWTVLTVLPAASALVAMLGKAYGWNGTDMIVLTINAVATFLGVITGVSAYNLKNRRKQMKKKITITAMSLLTALYCQLTDLPILSTMNLIWAQMKVAHK